MGAVQGMLRVELETADIPGILSSLNSRGISVFSVTVRDDVTLLLEIRREDWDALSRLCQIRGEQVRIRKRRGCYWQVKQMRKRPVLILGFLFLLTLILYLPGRVLFIRVEGNRTLPANQILEAAETCGLRFGASRRDVRSERLKNALLEALPGLQWAGVNTKGCVAVLSVRERTVQTKEPDAGFVSGIVAVREGIVTDCTAEKGNLLCAPGQAVRAGQLLISGFTDCGLTVRATSAQGEVFARTRAEKQAVTVAHCQKRGAEGEIQRKISLLIGKKRINLWKDSGIWDTSCGRIYSEYYVTLPGGFSLPLGIAVETITRTPLQEGDWTAEMAKQLLQTALSGYLRSEMIAGQILSREEAFSVESGVYTLAGEYVCTEMIGRVQREQIGE